jgi:hypothetical protein
MPVFGDWKGTGTPVLNLVARSGQLLEVSLFDTASNYNAVIAGQSGSGKSFLTNEPLATNLSVGRRCWVIDEAWDLLTQGDVAKFIETGYRRFRKYGGAAVTVTQSALRRFLSKNTSAHLSFRPSSVLRRQLHSTTMHLSSRLEDERKSCVIPCLLFRQSPKPFLLAHRATQHGCQRR